MNRARETIRAYIELARLSNIPTCFSNVLVGCAIGGLADWSQWRTVLSVTVAIGLLYVAGMALNDALDELTRRHPAKAQLVKLRYFGGLTVAEAADALGISSTTAQRHWAYARAWLQCRIAE